MAIKCIVGKIGAGKTTKCVEIIREKLNKREKLIYMVPEQDTVESELFLVERLHLPVLWDLDVLSPTRLCGKIRKEAGGSAKVLLSDAGRAMALRNAMHTLGSSLKVFRSGSIEAADQMGDLLVELKRGGNDPMSLHLAADRMPPENALTQKLYDLAAVYEEFAGETGGKYEDGVDLQLECAEIAEKCAYLTDKHILVDGFDVLPYSTIRLLIALSKVCASVTVTFSLCGENEAEAEAYAQVREAYVMLLDLCGAEGVAVETVTLAGRPHDNAELEALRQNLYARRIWSVSEKPECVHLVTARDPYMECERAAGYIFEQCRTKGLHYKEIAIVCGDMAAYENRIASALSKRGIRAYIDKKMSAIEHPAAHYLLSALTGAARYFRQEDMLRALKSGMCGLGEKECDRIELSVLEKGLEGIRWEFELPEEDTGNQSEGERGINEIKELFFAPIREFRDKGKTRSVRAFCEDTVCLMERVGMGNQLLALFEAAKADGDERRMQILSQVQDAVNDVLSQAVELCGDEECDIEDFIKLLRAGLAAVEIGAIPMSPDAVLVTTPQRAKLRNIRLLYVLGMNADSIPAPYSDNALLSESEKKDLMDAAKAAECEIKLNLMHNKAAVEQFLLQSLLTCPKDTLVLSCPSVDARGTALRPSVLLARVKRIFPNIVEECGIFGDRYVYAGSESAMADVLSSLWLTGKAGHAEALSLCQTLMETSPETLERIKKQETLLTPGLLNEMTAQMLYTRLNKQKKYRVDGLVAGISQLERYALCPFAHFVGFGLRPQEMKTPEMDPRDLGTLEHAAVEQFYKAMVNRKYELTDEEAEDLMVKTLEPLLENDAYHRHGGGLMLANHSEIKHALRRMSRLLATQNRVSGFVTEETERSFTPQDAPPLHLPDGRKVYLEGKIDRIDIGYVDGEKYARVIDYKTGSTALNMEDVFYGLRMQLLLYLSAVLRMEDAHPAGIFYQKLGDASVNLEGAEFSDKIAEKRNKKLRLSGYILENDEVIDEMCKDPAWTEQILPVERNKDGSFNKKSLDKLLPEEDFNTLLHHTYRKLNSVAKGILRGDTKIAPVETKESDSCRNCAYRPICLFENGLPGCEKKNLAMKHDEALERIRKEEENAELYE